MASFWPRLIGRVLVGFKTTGMGLGTAKGSGTAECLRGGEVGQKMDFLGSEEESRHLESFG